MLCLSVTVLEGRSQKGTAAAFLSSFCRIGFLRHTSARFHDALLFHVSVSTPG